MRYLKTKNVKLRRSIYKFEHLQFINKLINVNNYVSFFIKRNINTQSLKIRKQYSFVKVSKRCVVTNKQKIFNKYLNISRLNFLKYARFNHIYGLKKRIC